jgi:hypothetical protein
MKAELMAPVDTSPVEKRALSFAEKAKGIEICDEGSYAAGMSSVLAGKQLKREITEWFQPFTKKAHELHKSLTSALARATDPIDEVVNILDGKAKKYRREQEEKARQETLRLQREADQRAADRLIADAVAAEAAGDLQEAEKILDEKPVAPMVVVTPAVPKVEGISFREVWRGEVTSLKELCRAIADGTVPEDFVTANMAKVNASARAMKDALRIPGIVAIKDEVTSGKTAA